MEVHYEVDGAVVTLDRKEVGNAIDHPTADALAGAFRLVDIKRHAASPLRFCRRGVPTLREIRPRGTRAR